MEDRISSSQTAISRNSWRSLARESPTGKDLCSSTIMARADSMRSGCSQAIRLERDMCCAAADIDNDGDLDILVVENNGRARLWRNDLPKSNHWVRFMLAGRNSNRDGIGALIRVTVEGIHQRQWVKSGCSFLSQSSLRPT